jgi:hypothetical protein
MEDGQADTGPDTPDLVQFLIENPEADREETDEPSDEPAQADNSDEQEDQSAEGEDDDEEQSDDDAEPEKKPEQATGQKFTVTVKGEDGADQTLEVDQKELIAGYTRHADYTRKTQELATKEREAARIVTTKLEEGRNHYLQQAQLTHAAITRLAGLRTDAEMAALAQTDPSAWVQENQRATAIRNELQRLEQGMQAEHQQALQKQQETARERKAQAWEQLTKDGIDRPAMERIYSTVTKTYGLSAEQMAGVDDPRVVRMMRDAAAYHELKAKSAQVKKQAKAAPPLPPQRQTPTRSDQNTRRLNERFRSGRAGVKDLGAFILANKL